MESVKCLSKTAAKSASKTVSDSANVSSDDATELPRFDKGEHVSLLDVSGVKLLDEEEFDFDLPCSPTQSVTRSTKADDLCNRNTAVLDDDSDEIFIGPVGYTEKCISAAVEAHIRSGALMQRRATLTAAEMAELCKEAFTVASRIQLAVIDESPTRCDDDAISCSITLPDDININSSTDNVNVETKREKDAEWCSSNQDKDVANNISVHGKETHSEDTRDKVTSSKLLSSRLTEPTIAKPAIMKKRKLQNNDENLADGNGISLVQNTPIAVQEPLAKRPCVTLEAVKCTQLEGDKQLKSKESEAVSATKMPTSSQLPMAKGLPTSRLLPPGSLFGVQKLSTTATLPSDINKKAAIGICLNARGIPTPSIQRPLTLLPSANTENLKPIESRLSKLQPPKQMSKLNKK